MAIIALSYCSAAFAETVDLSYNDSTHEIDSGTLGAPCGGGVYPGTEIYSHDDGGYRYRVITQNYAPYAYVVQEELETCTVAIDSATPTNATNEAASDGAITISATGNGVKSYSLDGITWQNGNVFDELAPGTYTARVRNYFHGDYCYDTAEVTVGFDALSVCDLALGNVLTTAGPGGTLTIQDYAASVNEPVEYRLDVGAWQSSPVFTGLASGTYSVQIRFKNFTSCSDSRNVTLNSCDIVLQLVDVTHEQTKYGDDGAIRITVSGTATPFQYSIDDGGTYQSSNLFEGLAPGEYQVRVKDDNACEVFRTVEVLSYKKAVVVFPIANGHRLVITDGPVKDSGPQNFDNTLDAQMKFPAREACCFNQPFTNSDIVPLQWRSSYAEHTVKLYNSANVLQATLTPTKRTELIGHSETMDANFSNYGGGKTQIYFPDADFPTFLAIGQDITIAGEASLNGTYPIVDIVAGTGEAEGYQCAIVEKEYTSGTDPLTGTLTVVYDIEDYEVWEVAIDKTSLAAGKYYLLVIGTDPQFEDFEATSEPFEIVAEDEELVLLRWRNIDSAFLIDYGTGLEHLMRAPGELVPVAPGGEREVMEDSRRSILKLRENVTRQVQLNVYAIPYWVAEKIRIALAHDVVAINGVNYQPTDDLNIEQPDPTDMLCDVNVKLRQVDFIAENAHDDGSSDVDATETGNVILIGNWDASGNAFPTVEVRKGHLWRISVAGTLNGVPVEPGAKILALRDNPGQTLSNWDITF